MRPLRYSIRSSGLQVVISRSLQGSTPDRAFYVKCDGQTTSESDRKFGAVNIDVGFAPLNLAGFVVIKIIS